MSHTVPDVHALWILPFALLLAAIAIMPLWKPRFWEHQYAWFAILLGAVTSAYYLLFLPEGPSAWLHQMQEYVSFIVLLGSLYIVSGGIVIHISRRATPAANTTLLLVGAIAANVFGTTGAAMLLIRPFLRMNRGHIKPFHVAFFIIIVANCGGALTPIGDPPLYMGFIRGVPFFWLAESAWMIWAVCNALLLILFFLLDSREHARVARHHQHDPGPAVQLYGFQNFFYIGLILLAVFQPSLFDALHDENRLRLFFNREAMMIAALLLSLITTQRYIHERNEFKWGPIREVAILFLGIFSTMVPALNYMHHHSDRMPLNTPGQYYYLSGSLSAALDNAPTYLVFFETQQSRVAHDYAEPLARLRQHLDAHPPGTLPPPPPNSATPGRPELLAYEALVRYFPDRLKSGQVRDSDIRIAATISNPDLALLLIAISFGSVFFGACTYIGNGPNFMVKSIAEHAGVPMPSFFGYLFRYALPILLPIYTLIWLLFFVLAVPG